MWVDDIPIAVVEEVVAEEASVAGPALRVEDPELRSPARWSGPLLLDDDLRPLAHHLPAETDPCPSTEPETEPRRLRERADRPGREPRRLEEDEERAGAPGDGGEAEEPLGEALDGGRGPLREVHDEDVGDARAEEVRPQVDPVRDGPGRDDDEVREPDAAGGRLHGIQRPRRVHVCDERADDLRLRDDAERERGPAAPRIAGDRGGGGARKAARAEKRVEDGEPGGDDRPDPGAVRTEGGPRKREAAGERDRARRADERPSARRRAVDAQGRVADVRERRDGERAEHLRRRSRGRGAPSRAKVREYGEAIVGGAHGTHHDRTSVLLVKVRSSPMNTRSEGVVDCIDRPASRRSPDEDARG
jgi:hypothetical protein